MTITAPQAQYSHLGMDAPKPVLVGMRADQGKEHSVANALEFARRYAAFHNAHDLTRADELFADDVSFFAPAAPGKVVHGLANLKRFLGDLHRAFPDLHFSVEEAYGEGESIAWRGSARLTLTNAFGPFQPTGKTAEVPLAEFYRLRDGKIAEARVFTDSLWMMQQLGIVAGS